MVQEARERSVLPRRTFSPVIAEKGTVRPYYQYMIRYKYSGSGQMSTENVAVKKLFSGLKVKLTIRY